MAGAIRSSARFNEDTLQRIFAGQSICGHLPSLEAAHLRMNGWRPEIIRALMDLGFQPIPNWVSGKGIRLWACSTYVILMNGVVRNSMHHRGDRLTTYLSRHGYTEMEPMQMPGPNKSTHWVLGWRNEAGRIRVFTIAELDFYVQGDVLVSVFS